MIRPYIITPRNLVCWTNQHSLSKTEDSTLFIFEAVIWVLPSSSLLHDGTGDTGRTGVLVGHSCSGDWRKRPQEADSRSWRTGPAYFHRGAPPAWYFRRKKSAPAPSYGRVARSLQCAPVSARPWALVLKQHLRRILCVNSRTLWLVWVRGASGPRTWRRWTWRRISASTTGRRK